MGRKGHFTLVIVPHSSGKVRSTRLSVVWLGVAATCIGVAAIALFMYASHYLQLLQLMPELAHLREVVVSQRRQIGALVSETTALDREFQELVKLESQVRDLLASIDLAPGGSVIPPEVRVASTSAGSPSLTMDSTLIKDQGGGSLALGSMALTHLDSLRNYVNRVEYGLAEVRDELSQLQMELRAYPSIWPVNGRITSGFGYRRSPFGWGTEFHGGIDIAAPYGTPIAATADGEVVFSAFRVGYGNTVIIDHGFGYRTLYAHNAQNLVRVGSTVLRGDTIALLGRSGRTTGPHVHYEVHYMGQRVNPRPYLEIQ